MQSSANLPFISVVVPVYNVAAYLEEAIQSILAQTLPSFEIILVNDGSTDESAAICKKYEAQEPRVHYIFQENQGVSVARNNGLKQATGQYVFFMDSDDTLDPHFLETSLVALQRENSDVVLISAYFLRRLPHVHSLPTHAQMWRSTFLMQHPDLWFPPGLQPCEDGLFSHRLLALTNRLTTNPVGVYHYRHHNQQNHVTINKNTGKVVRQVPEWLTLLDAFYTRYNLYKTHARHLALFVEHEPFELRYLGMPISDEEKAFLHPLIKNFMTDKVTPHLSASDKKRLSKPFLRFLSAARHQTFDGYFTQYRKKRKQQKQRLILLTKFVFIFSLKQYLRKKIRAAYEDVTW